MIDDEHQQTRVLALAPSASLFKFSTSLPD